MKTPQCFCNYVSKTYKIMLDKKTESHFFGKNLAYLMSGFGIATFISGFFTIYSGKILGPENYGTYTLICSIMNFLSVPFLLGLNASIVNINAKIINKKEKQTAISTALILVILLTLIFSILFILTTPLLENIFSVPKRVIQYSIILSVFFTLSNMSNSILESNFMMKIRGYTQIIYSVVTLLTFIFIVPILNSYLAVLFSVIIGYTFSSIPAIYATRQYITNKVELSMSKTLLTYGVFSSISGISASVLSNIDRIMLNNFLDTFSVGIYQAYSSSYLFVPSFFMSIIITVLFPFFSKSKDKNELIHKVDEVMRYIPLLFIFIFVLGYVVLKLYGSEYQFNTGTALLFSFDALLFICTSVYSRLASSMGLSGAKFLSKTVTLKAVINIVLNYIFIPHYGINGAVSATIICNMISVSAYRYIYLKKYVV